MLVNLEVKETEKLKRKLKNNTNLCFPGIPPLCSLHILIFPKASKTLKNSENEFKIKKSHSNLYH